MNLALKAEQLQGLSCILQEVTEGEQTQEIRLSEGMPDVGNVIGAWGQAILRSKQWHSDHISCSCGLQVWVLYEPEGEGALQVLSSWIPFQLCWDMEPVSIEGDMRIHILTRYADARSVSPRKIMVRAGIAGVAEARIRKNWDALEPQQETIPVLRKKHTVRLWKESGEKAFVLDEELAPKESAPSVKKLIYCKLDPVLQECRVVGDKLAFRGQGRLHTLYQGESGQVHSWDFEIPYSQYAQLKETYGNDGECDMRFAVTGMEAELQDNGKIRIKCGITGQYLISQQEEFSVAEDAYLPDRELELKKEYLTVQNVSGRTRMTIPIDLEIPEDSNLVADTLFSPDYPVVQDTGSGKLLYQPGTMQVLWYGPDGKLHSHVSRWEGKACLQDAYDPDGKLIPQTPDIQAETEQGSIRLKGELLLLGYDEEKRRIPMVTEATPGKERLQGNKPSVILLRCAEETLWEIAKRTGSTVETITEANDLEGECEPGKLLLIPVK